MSGQALKTSTSSKCISVVLSGVGGQGTLVAGKLLGKVAMKTGLDVKVSEVHGMSQRGGSVITYVRMGCKVYSPIIDEGMADFCLFFEPLEAIRWVSLLKKGGTMIINSAPVKPLPVLLGNEKYPDRISERIKEAGEGNARVIEIDAKQTAVSFGSAKAANIVMIGALSIFTDIPESVWKESIEESFSEKPHLISMNLDAFQAGRDLVR
ncbi:MAG: indolepyruvate oxidoreductase subunit beta [Clostridiaceae bacterium]|nr:indolepyruvate oxidoreductase subunit beta [Clostridiaceae bacterium]